MRIEKIKYRKVSFDDSQELKDKVFDKLISWYLKHEAFSGESIQQCDGPTIDSVVVLSEIADEIIRFEVDYVEEI